MFTSIFLILIVSTLIKSNFGRPGSDNIVNNNNLRFNSLLDGNEMAPYTGDVDYYNQYERGRLGQVNSYGTPSLVMVGGDAQSYDVSAVQPRESMFGTDFQNTMLENKNSLSENIQSYGNNNGLSRFGNMLGNNQNYARDLRRLNVDSGLPRFGNVGYSPQNLNFGRLTEIRSNLNNGFGYESNTAGAFNDALHRLNSNYPENYVSRVNQNEVFPRRNQIYVNGRVRAGLFNRVNRYGSAVTDFENSRTNNRANNGQGIGLQFNRNLLFNPPLPRSATNTYKVNTFGSQSNTENIGLGMPLRRFNEVVEKSNVDNNIQSKSLNNNAFNRNVALSYASNKINNNLNAAEMPSNNNGDDGMQRQFGFNTNNNFGMNMPQSNEVNERNIESMQSDYKGIGNDENMTKKIKRQFEFNTNNNFGMNMPQSNEVIERNIERTQSDNNNKGIGNDENIKEKIQNSNYFMNEPQLNIPTKMYSDNSQSNNFHQLRFMPSNNNDVNIPQSNNNFVNNDNYMPSYGINNNGIINKEEVSSSTKQDDTPSNTNEKRLYDNNMSQRELGLNGNNANIQSYEASSLNLEPSNSFQPMNLGRRNEFISESNFGSPNMMNSAVNSVGDNTDVIKASSDFKINPNNRVIEDITLTNNELQRQPIEFNEEQSSLDGLSLSQFPSSL